jgi:hypothetical protein
MTSLGFPKQFDINVSFVIANFLTPLPYKFFDFIYTKKRMKNGYYKPTKRSLKHINKLNWFIMTETLPQYLLEKFKHKIIWPCLGKNKNAINLIERHLDKIDWTFLSANPNAIHILKKHKDRINFHFLCANPNGMELVTEICKSTNYCYLDRHSWFYLCKNPNSISFMSELTNNFTTNLHKIHWVNFYANPNAIHILFKHQDKIHWESLSSNENINEFMKLLTPEQYSIVVQKLDWYHICGNSNAIPIIEYALKHCPEKVEWSKVCTNPKAIHLIEPLVKIDDRRIDWSELSCNSNAIHILSQNIHKINWVNLCWKNENAHLILQNVNNMLDKHLFLTAVSQNPCLYEIDWNTYSCIRKVFQKVVYNL